MCGCVRGWFSPLQQGCSPPDDLPQHYNRGNAPRFYWRAFFPPCHPTFPSLFLSLYPHIDLSFSHHLEIFPSANILSLFNLRTRSFLPSACLSSSFAHAVFFLPLCFILFTLMRDLSLSLSLSSRIVPLSFHRVSFCSFSAHMSFSINRYPSCSLACSVLFSLINQRCRPGGGIPIPLCTCAQFTYNSVSLSPSFIPHSYPQLLDARGKDLRRGLFRESR